MIAYSEFPKSGFEADGLVLTGHEAISQFVFRPLCATRGTYIQLAQIARTAVDELERTAIGIELQILRAAAFRLYHHTAELDVISLIMNLSYLKDGNA